MGKPSNRGFSRNVHPQAYQIRVAEESKFDIEGLEKELKPLIIGLIEKAFRRYVHAHGTTQEVEDLEWTRFKKILNRML